MRNSQLPSAFQRGARHQAGQEIRVRTGVPTITYNKAIKQGAHETIKDRKSDGVLRTTTMGYSEHAFPWSV